MFKNKKIILSLAAILVLIISGLAYANSPVRLFIYGQEINTDVPPQTIDGRVMVPVRVVSEYLGSSVDWDANNNAVYIQSNNDTQHVDTSTNTGTGLALTKEQKAELLKTILFNSARNVESDIGRTEMISDLHYANTYVYLHADYTKFNALFAEEFINNENISPALFEIDLAYINALKTVDFAIANPESQFVFDTPNDWYTRTQTNFKIVLDIFNKYISIDGKYY